MRSAPFAAHPVLVRATMNRRPIARIVAPFLMTLSMSLLAAFVADGPRGPADAAELTVVYDAPVLTVEARDVAVAQVLEEIGARVGFRVVDHGASAEPRRFSIREASLADVLRQLLRGESYTMVYTAGRNP